MSHKRFATSDQGRLVELLRQAGAAIVDALPNGESPAGTQDLPATPAQGPKAPRSKRQAPA